LIRTAVILPIKVARPAFKAIEFSLPAIGSNEIIIKEFTEYPHDVSAALEGLEKDKIVPLSYTILGQKNKN